jgi:hypothetical protein
LTSYASLYFCLLAGADIEQAEDEEALDYEHEAPRSTYFADLADDSSDDTDDDEITGSAPGTPPDSHSSRQPSRDLDSAPPSRSPSRSPSVESIQRPMPRGPVQPLTCSTTPAGIRIMVEALRCLEARLYSVTRGLSHETRSFS